LFVRIFVGGVGRRIVVAVLSLLVCAAVAVAVFADAAVICSSALVLGVVSISGYCGELRGEFTECDAEMDEPSEDSSSLDSDEAVLMVLLMGAIC
jgi:predicted glycosyltransferase